MTSLLASGRRKLVRSSGVRTQSAPFALRRSPESHVEARAGRYRRSHRNERRYMHWRRYRLDDSSIDCRAESESVLTIAFQEKVFLCPNLPWVLLVQG